MKIKLHKLLYLMFLIGLIGTSPVVFAEDKVDALIKTYNYENEFKDHLEKIKSSFEPASKIKGSPEYLELANSHKKEEINLFNDSFNWEKIKSDLRDAYKRTYTDQEINAAYEFSKTELGEAFFKKNLSMNYALEKSISIRSREYIDNLAILQKKHSKESKALLDKLAQELPPVVEQYQKLTVGDIVKFSVYRENGQMIGYKVRPGSEQELFEKSPFKAGDIVISMNGIEVNDPKKIREVYGMVKTMDQIHFEIKRNDGIQDFVIDILEYNKK